MKTLHKNELSQEQAEDWLSLLMDGESAGQERPDLVKRLCHDAEARERWALYHGTITANLSFPVADIYNPAIKHAVRWWNPNMGWLLGDPPVRDTGRGSLQK